MLKYNGGNVLGGGVILYAIIKIGGKQQKVEEGKYIKTEKIDGEKGDQVEIGEVLAVNRDGEMTVGKPYIDGAKIVGKIIEQGRDSKVTVFKYKPKKDYRRKTGHRQHFTKVLIEEIQVPQG